MPNNEAPLEEGRGNVQEEEPVVEEEAAVEALSLQDMMFQDVKRVNISDIQKYSDPRIIPTFTRKELNTSLEEVDRGKLQSLSEEVRATFYLNNSSEEFITYDDAGHKSELGANTNKPTHGDKPLTMKTLTSHKRAKGKKSALMKLSQKTGIGSMIHIPLWHSGFWVSINPLTNEEIINLELELVNEIARVGKATNMLVFSNYSVLFAEVILKYFVRQIDTTSVALDDDIDIMDIILAPDIHTIALGLAKSMYPKGFNAIIPCRNSLKLTKDAIPSCDFKASLKLDLEELHWVDGGKVQVPHSDQMSNKAPNSVTLDSVIAYQDSLEAVGSTTKRYASDDEDDDDIILVLKVPSAKRYLESGKIFISELREKAIDLVKNSDQLDSTKDAEELLLKSLNLQLYNSYIDSIPVDDTALTTIRDINEALSVLSSSLDKSKDILKDISAYVNNSNIVTIGTPNFVCSDCSTKQTDTELIPLAVYEYFFILLHSKYVKITDKLDKQKKS